MDNRPKLQNELNLFIETVYYQPPSNHIMRYPCIVYTRKPPQVVHASNDIHKYKDSWQITLIEKDSTSRVAVDMLNHFSYCSITGYEVVDNLYHTFLQLYY